MFDHNMRKPYRINNRKLPLLRHVQAAGADVEYLKSLVLGFLDRRVFQPEDLRLGESARMMLKREWKTLIKEKPEVIRKHLTA